MWESNPPVPARGRDADGFEVREGHRTPCASGRDYEAGGGRAREGLESGHGHHMTLAAGARLGPYEVLAPIGAGGMGEVYRARDTRLGREVALKVLPEALASDRERLSRFEQEARSASALNHPNIITIHDIGREGNTEYIAMELVDGKTLRELAASGSLPVRKILGVAAQVAEGLAKAHSAGIVHRDLKPENVMVSKDGFVKILDFGLAKLVEPESGGVSAMPTLAQPETRPGTVMGTVGYMSPEQASGDPLDFRSDQFSLGAMLYEMATGQKAFQRKTAAETMSAIIRDEPEPVAKLRPDLPLPVRWILERCLAKDPDERYASTRDLARDLAGVRDHISEASSGSEAALAGAGARPRRRALPLVAGVALLAAGLAVGWGIAHGFTRKIPPAPSFKRLTFRQGQLGNARFAPDGRTILYGAVWEGGSQDMQLYFTRPESPESRHFEIPGADILSISSSGELAILLNDTVFSQGGTLARLPMAGGVARSLLENVPYGSADWAPDGKELAVVHDVEGKSRLEFPIGRVILEADSIQGPRFSPKGDRIAFWEFGETISVSAIDKDGKRKMQLSSGWSTGTGVPCWTPDGEEIWFTAAQQGQPDALWAVDRSGQRRLVTRVPGTLELDDIARDGRVLVAHHATLRSLLGRTPNEPKERDLSWLDSSSPSDLSKDGKTLILTERGEGSGTTSSIYLRGTDGGPAVRLGEGFAMALSPDGKWVVVTTEPGARKLKDLTLLPTGSGETKTLKNAGFTDFGWAAFSPDGKKIVFSAEAPGRPSRIYVQDIPDGGPRPIGPEGSRLPPWSNPVSPDGRFVVGQRKGQYSLHPVGGGDARPVPALSEEDLVIQWTADGRSLYVFRRGGKPTTRVFLVDVETGQRRLWREIEHVGALGRLRVTPDGGSYVYSTVRTLSELYVVEGLR